MRFASVLLVFLSLVLIYLFIFGLSRGEQLNADALFHDEWTNYRLGDAFKFTDKKFGTMNNKTAGEYHLTEFPESIAARYASASGNKRRKMEILESVVKQCCSELQVPTAKPHQAVVHLRIGDVVDQKLIDKYKRSDSTFVSRIVPVETYKQLPVKLKSMGVTEVTLVGGIHVKESHGTPVDPKYSLDYINTVLRYFAEVPGLKTEFISSEPDVDFCRMVGSEVFVPSKGNYSEFASELAERAGHKIVKLDGAQRSAEFLA